MRIATEVVLALTIVTAAAGRARSESNVARAEEHLRKACQLVWAGAAQQVESCTQRAMASLSLQSEARDNELKRLLFDSESELATCQALLEPGEDDGHEREFVSPSLSSRRERSPL